MVCFLISGKQQQANYFVRTNMRINEIINETTSGGIAAVIQPLGAVIKRPNPSIYKTKKKRTPKKESIAPSGK
jgi:hypothetical protein